MEATLLIVLSLPLVFSQTPRLHCEFDGRVRGERLSLVECFRKGGIIAGLPNTNLIARGPGLYTVCCRSPPNVIAKRKCNEWPVDCGVLHVTGGRDASIGEFPHMVSIQTRPTNRVEKARHICGGSLIDPRYVLTAAHCIRDLGPVKLYVRHGLVDITSKIDENLIPVVDSLMHPEYFRIPGSKYSDIAILKLKTPMSFGPNRFPACLPELLNFGRTQEFEVAGWGSNGSLAETLVLQTAKLTFIPNDQCEKSYGPLFKTSDRDNPYSIGFTDTILCAGSFQADACQGDSGGPLMINPGLESSCKKILVGVVSTGPVTCAPGNPGIYTRVDTFLPWIVDYVWPEEV